MSDVYFGKELISNAVLLNGAAVPFEVLDGNRGVIKLDTEANKQMVAGLEQLAAQQRGGVYKISAAQYAEKKSLFPYNPSKPFGHGRNDQLRVAPQGPPARKQADAAAVRDAFETPPTSSESPTQQLAPERPATARVGKRLGRPPGKLAAAIQAKL